MNFSFRLLSFVSKAIYFIALIRIFTSSSFVNGDQGTLSSDPTLFPPAQCMDAYPTVITNGPQCNGCVLEAHEPTFLTFPTESIVHTTVTKTIVNLTIVDGHHSTRYNISTKYSTVTTTDVPDAISTNDVYIWSWNGITLTSGTTYFAFDKLQTATWEANSIGDKCSLMFEDIPFSITTAWSSLIHASEHPSIRYMVVPSPLGEYLTQQPSIASAFPAVDFGRCSAREPKPCSSTSSATLLPRSRQRRYEPSCTENITPSTISSPPYWMSSGLREPDGTYPTSEALQPSNTLNLYVSHPVSNSENYLNSTGRASPCGTTATASFQSTTGGYTHTNHWPSTSLMTSKIYIPSTSALNKTTCFTMGSPRPSSFRGNTTSPHYYNTTIIDSSGTSTFFTISLATSSLSVTTVTNGLSTTGNIQHKTVSMLTSVSTITENSYTNLASSMSDTPSLSGSEEHKTSSELPSAPYAPPTAVEASASSKGTSSDLPSIPHVSSTHETETKGLGSPTEVPAIKTSPQQASSSSTNIAVPSLTPVLLTTESPGAASLLHGQQSSTNALQILSMAMQTLSATVDSAEASIPTALAVSQSIHESAFPQPSSQDSLLVSKSTSSQSVTGGVENTHSALAASFDATLLATSLPLSIDVISEASPLHGGQSNTPLSSLGKAVNTDSPTYHSSNFDFDSAVHQSTAKTAGDTSDTMSDGTHSSSTSTPRGGSIRGSVRTTTALHTDDVSSTASAGISSTASAAGKRLKVSPNCLEEWAIALLGLLVAGF